MPQCVQALDFLVPLAVEPRDLLAVTTGHRPAGEQLRETLERRARVADERSAVVLDGIEVGDVDVDEPHLRVAECRLRRGREVGPASADAEDEVGLGGEAVGCERSGHPDRAERGGMVIRQRSLARLGLPHRNPRLFAESAQRVCRT